MRGIAQHDLYLVGLEACAGLHFCAESPIEQLGGCGSGLDIQPTGAMVQLDPGAAGVFQRNGERLCSGCGAPFAKRAGQ